MRISAMASIEDALLRLTSMTLKDLGLLWKDREVVTARESSKVLRAFQLLSSHEISALPVVDDEGCIQSVLSNADIAVLATDDFNVEDISKDQDDMDDPAHRATMQIKLAIESIKRLDMSVKEYVALARKCKSKNRSASRFKSAIVASADSTLLLVMESLYKNSIHRVFIVDEMNKPVGVVSLKDVLNALTLRPNQKG